MVAARRPDGRRIPFWENPEYTLFLPQNTNRCYCFHLWNKSASSQMGNFYPYRKWSYAGLLPTAKDIIVKKISRQPGELPSGEIPSLDIEIEFGSIMA